MRRCTQREEDKKLERRSPLAITLTLLLVNVLALAFNTQIAQTEPKTIRVPTDYPTIQGAINAANPGDVVFVYNGTYYEHVVVNKTLSLIGETRDTTIIDGSKAGSVIFVSEEDAQVSGFTVQNGDYGVYIGEFGPRSNVWGNIVANNSLYGIITEASWTDYIHENIVMKNNYGVYLKDSYNNTLRNNNITLNRYNFGVEATGKPSVLDFFHDIDASNVVDGKPTYYLVNQQNNQVPPDAGFVAAINSTNIIVENVNLTANVYGVLLVGSTNCLIDDIEVSNSENGIYLLYSDSNEVTDNIIINNSVGIVNWFGSSDNNILRNTIMNNSGYGILFHGPGDDRNNVSENIITNSSSGIHLGGSSYRNNISNNTILDNSVGIFMDFSKSNIFSMNKIADNTFGIELWSTSLDNIFYNNFINNGQHTLVRDGRDSWDNGYPFGGNYWTGYTGVDEKSGPNQDQVGSDGIGDTAYIIDVYNRDRYPLMNTWPSIHDTAVLSLVPSTNTPAINETIYIHVTVQNQGHFTETLNINLYYTRLSDPLIGTQTLALASGANTTVTFEWTPNITGTYKIKAESCIIPSEIDLADNTHTVIAYVTYSGKGPIGGKKI